jgi:hypothetical protein
LRVAYTSSSLALASLEYFVNLDPVDAPADLVSVRVDFPRIKVESRSLAPTSPPPVPRAPDCTQTPSEYSKKPMPVEFDFGKMKEQVRMFRRKLFGGGMRYPPATVAETGRPRSNWRRQRVQR